MLTLYHAASSVCSQKARLALAEKGLQWKSELLDLGKGDQFEDWYLKLNPDAVVPTLVDGSTVVRESGVILEYVDELGGGPPLMPSNRAARAATKLWLARTILIHEAINSLTFGTYMRTMELKHRTPEETEARLASMPNPQIAAKRRDLFAKGAKSVFVDGAIQVMLGVFRDIHQAMQVGDYLCGPEYGLSDVALTAYVDRVSRLSMGGMWRSRFARVDPWLDRMRGRDSYETAVGSFLTADMVEFARQQGEEAWPEIARRIGD